MMQTIQITRENLGIVVQLPCITKCFKMVSGSLRFAGTFESKKLYAKEGDWLVQVSEKKWRCIPDDEYQRIKNRL